MRPRDRARLRFVAWACLIAVLIAAASPVSAGLPQAILAPAGPVLSEPAAVSVRLGTEETSPPNRLVLRALAARAPPVA